jgi:hypothetical protein
MGTHEPSWLSKVDVPLFVSRRRLARYKRALPVARGPWALDSGGFTELNMHGRWVTSEAEYLEAVDRYTTEIGQLAWAAPMDWMCEPFVIEKSGMPVSAHQERTVQNYLDLRSAAPDLPFIPVLQGWTLDDYLRCVDLYAAAGVDLRTLPLVGIGSVCRRQHTGEIDVILRAVAGLGIALHGFGVKTLGLSRYSDVLASADSLAWSYRARRSPALAGCTHKSCANCPRFALRWRERVLRSDAPRLPFGVAT